MRTTVTIIGAGPSGLAMSRVLTEMAIDHVVLERAEPANSWRTERWDSLRLLTPNWMTRLPGLRFDGSDPGGYMHKREVVDLLDRYHRSFAAPVVTRAAVRKVSTRIGGYAIESEAGLWHSRAVVVASGAASSPRVPSLARHLPFALDQITALGYRNPDQVPPGRVLVVGGSASGVQIADELLRAGREVVVAVGTHTRLPRTYRGTDIHWWLDAMGRLDERHDQVDDIGNARRLPSAQLIGSPERRSLDLNSLISTGGGVVGRLVGATPERLQFSGSLPSVCALADLKQNRLLAAIDAYAADHGLDPELSEPTRPQPTAIPVVRTEIRAREFGSVVWATGYGPDYPWLEPHLLDRGGSIRHAGGVVCQPGMYVLGLPFMRRRKSSFLGGVGGDAVEVGGHLASYLDSIAIAV